MSDDGAPRPGHAIVAVDRTGAITQWDAGAEALFGHRHDEVLGRPVDLIVPERYHEAHWAAFHRAIATGVSRLDGQATTLATRHADGSEHLLPARFVFLRDPRGRAVGVMAIYNGPTGHDVEWEPPVPWETA